MQKHSCNKPHPTQPGWVCGLVIDHKERADWRHESYCAAWYKLGVLPAVKRWLLRTISRWDV